MTNQQNDDEDMSFEEDKEPILWKRKLIRGTDPQFLIEKIIRERIYESIYWKEKLFGVNAELLCDRAVEMNCIGGLYANQRPTEFLSLTLKLLQLQPEQEILNLYLENPEFKYLTALAAFYIRLTAPAVDVYKYLEPLLLDNRKLRKRTNAGAFVLSYMDEFVDELLTSDRCCDTILPRIPNRYILEDSGELEPRYSPLEDELNELEDGEELDDNDEEDDKDEDDKDEDNVDQTANGEDKDQNEDADAQPGEKRKKWSKSKIKSLFKKEDGISATSSTDRDQSREALSIEETNRIRAQLGLKPLQM